MVSLKDNNRGFTLIELMITVAVVAILAAIAWPNYQESVRKARRADAQGVIMEGAQFLERFYTENNRYDQDSGGGAVTLAPALSASPKDGAGKFYTVVIQSVTPSSYTLRATPLGSQVGDGILELSNTGLKGWDRDDNGVVVATEQCWSKSC